MTHAAPATIRSDLPRFAMPDLRILPLSLLLLVLTPACDADPGDLTEAGYTALGAGDSEGALKEFERALDEIGTDTSHPHFLRAKLGAIEARIRVDAEAAKREFLDLAAGMPSQITARDFSTLGGKFAGAKQYLAAIDLLDAGMKAHSESPDLKALQDDIRAAAQQSGDQDALDKLSSLGYTGGD